MSPGNGSSGREKPLPTAAQTLITHTGTTVTRPDAVDSSGTTNATAVIATALVLPPSGRRRSWLLLVINCPLCPTGGHVHRGSPRGGVRRAGCGHGEYRVVPGKDVTAKPGEVAA